MPRILIDGEWYEELNTRGLYEDEFEEMFLRESPCVTPSHYAIKFKRLVESEYGDAKPDLALIDHDYRYWIVVEVELGHHSFEGHVLPQVTKLQSGSYDTSHAEYIYSQNTQLNLNRLNAMVKGESPSVIVLANCPKPEWTADLARIGVTLHSFQIYRSDQERFIFSVDLSLPQRPRNLLSRCLPDRHMPGWVRVESPGALPDTANKPIKIDMDGTTTFWNRMDVEGAVYLMPSGRNFLNPRHTYEIYQNSSGGLELKSTKGGH